MPDELRFFPCDFEDQIAEFLGDHYIEAIKVASPVKRETGLYIPDGWFEVTIDQLSELGFQDFLHEKEEIQKAKEEAQTQMEGAVAFARCWECGTCKIIGEIRNGHVVRIPKPEWKRVQQAFRKAWAAQFEGAENEPLSSVGTGWVEKFEELSGRKAVITETYYCGC